MTIKAIAIPYAVAEAESGLESSGNINPEDPTSPIPTNTKAHPIYMKL